MDLFKEILIPVDFSINTEMEIRKAIELVQPANAVVHLLHIFKRNPFAISSNKNKVKLAEVNKKLQEWKYTIEETIEGVSCKIHLVHGGSVQNNIIKTVKQIGCPLIIIGDNKKDRVFPFFKTVDTNYIAKITKCPVLTVRPGMAAGKMKSIVVPVRDFIPRKIEMVATLAKKYKARIYLVTLTSTANADTGYAQQPFLQAYRMLKANLGIAIDYKVLKGNNLVKSSLEFAKNIGADMILVNPDEETRMSSFSYKHINDLLPGSQNYKYWPWNLTIKMMPVIASINQKNEF